LDSLRKLKYKLLKLTKINIDGCDILVYIS
jgi:hypothetical protein